MTVKSAKKTLWPITLVLLAGLLYAAPAHALRINFNTKGDSDRLVFSFDSGQMYPVSVKRTGKQTLQIGLSDGIWEYEAKPGSKDFPGKLVKALRPTKNGVQITTSTTGFGYIQMPSPDKKQFVLQLFRDPIGSRWKPQTQQQPKVKPAPRPAQPAAQPKPKPKPKPKPAQPKVPAAPVQQAEAPKSAVQAQSAPSGEPEAGGTGTQGTDRKPFFSVPYSVRNQVTPLGEGQPQPVEQEATPQQVTPDQSTPQQVMQQDLPPESPQPVVPVRRVAPEADSGQYPDASELRFKAVDRTAEQVKFAELAGRSSGSAPVIGQVSQPVAMPMADQASGEASGTVGGTVDQEPAPDSPQPVVAQSVAPQPVQDASSVAGGVTPPEESSAEQSQPPAEPVAEQAQPPAIRQITEQPASDIPEVSGDGQVGGSVGPPPTVVEGAPPPELTPEEGAQVEQPVMEEPPAEADVPAEEVAETQTAEADVATEEAATDPATDPAAEGESPDSAEDPVKTAEQREEEIRNQLYEAQSMMFNGNLPEALTIYEDILKNVKLPDDVREETLYAVADIKKQLHSDDLVGNFEELSQAFLEALNSNLRSNRVPRSLLNLGLLNLQVGNFPEAKAYFKILQEKYPDDDNIPSISYYWGEYYYKKGEYKKAADQFQYLIQTYPEHQLVKQAAFYLADSLDKTGFIEQAFQIVDYIDKRWPDYYMENPEFLLLAGDVEMKLKKWPEAKNHYFTAYNLNPEADNADILLAHLGDIYVFQDEKKAARQIYEKAVEDFPDKEGGLIAKMRLAEEGVYDDPSLPQMGSVFNRPYNKRPEVIYQEIVEQHPESPLAPIAQLKLAMWYAFNKKYPEALAAAQDMTEKYPDHKLVDRARKLGDSVFALAVPGMVAEGRYGRVVRYWETYDFIGQEDTKVDDWTRLSVATSYWKIGQPQKALDLLQPYLQKKQVKDVSDKALGLAVNIYLDDLAWKEIADLVAMAKKHWNLQDEQLRQLDYARAMSLQNLGHANKALPIWAELAKNVEVDPAFRGYAMYYMAKAAMERQDLRKVFVYAQEALALLLQTNGDPEKIKDAVLMSIYATERSGRYSEALKWAREFDKYIEPDNPEWASTRFKLARIYRKAGAMDEWKQLLTDIIEKKPDSLQAQLAQSALETYDLEQKAEQYAPAPQ